MATDCWMHIGPGIPGPEIHALMAALLRCSISAKPAPVVNPAGLGLCVAGEITDEMRDFLRSSSALRDSKIIAVMMARDPGTDAAWDLLRCGASDVLSFTNLDDVVSQIESRFQRWMSIESL